MNKLGLIIGRLQPPHIGHTMLVHKALDENSTVLILLGGNGEINHDNPFSFEQRDELLQTIYEDSDILIDEILDNPSDEFWVDMICEKIHSFGNYDEINIYCGDIKNDSAIRALKKFEENLLTPVKYNEITRSEVTTLYHGEQVPISATLVRNSLQNGDFEDIKGVIPKQIRDQVIELFS